MALPSNITPMERLGGLKGKSLMVKRKGTGSSTVLMARLKDRGIFITVSQLGNGRHMTKKGKYTRLQKNNYNLSSGAGYIPGGVQQ